MRFDSSTGTSNDSYLHVDSTHNFIWPVAQRFEPENTLKLAIFDKDGTPTLICKVECLSVPF